MKLGEGIPNSEIEDIMKEQNPSDCALLIYTVSYSTQHILGNISSLIHNSIHDGPFLATC